MRFLLFALEGPLSEEVRKFRDLFAIACLAMTWWCRQLFRVALSPYESGSSSNGVFCTLVCSCLFFPCCCGLAIIRVRIPQGQTFGIAFVLIMCSPPESVQHFCSCHHRSLHTAHRGGQTSGVALVLTWYTRSVFPAWECAVFFFKYYR